MRHALLQVFLTGMCVGSVCAQPPYNDKDPPSAFIFLFFLKSSRSQMSEVCVTSRETPTIVDWHWCFILDPPWVSHHQSVIVSTPEHI